MRNLNRFKKNITSQAGEDGIIEYLCERIGLTQGWCVEFGAWDGKYLSNTNSLFLKRGWSAVLIEGDPERFRILNKTYGNQENIYTIKCYVGFQDDDPYRLDELLKQTPIPKDFELLSIDVDGNDWFIWKSIKYYYPKIVIIEANSTFNFDVYKVGEQHSGDGASALALTELGKKKGYELVAHTGNCIFVRKEYFPAVDIDDNSLAILFEDKFYKAEQRKTGFFRRFKEKIQGRRNK